MSVAKNISFSMLTNIWALLINVGLSFVTPYFIPVEDFGYLRTFMLYASFSGIMHFGFIDGIYLYFAGKEIRTVSRPYFYALKKIYFWFQSAIGLSLFLFGLMVRQELLCFFALASLLINLFNFGNYFFQSISQFKIFTKVNFITNLFLGLSIFCIFFLFKAKDYHYVIYTLILSYALGAAIYEFFYRRSIQNNLNEEGLPNKKTIFSIVRLGGLILVGNLLFVYLLMADKWVVNLFFPKHIFAYYSFAGSIIAIVTALITSISMALYPMLVKNYTLKSVGFLKVFTLIASIFALSTYFFATILISYVFKNYLSSIILLQYMVLTLPPISIIGVISVNFYKINKLGYQYVLDLLIIALVGALIYLAAFYIFKSTTGIAIASVICLNFALWYINRRNNMFSFAIKDLSYYLISVTSFLSFTHFVKNIYFSGIGFVIFCLLFTIMIYLNEIKELFTKFERK